MKPANQTPQVIYVNNPHGLSLWTQERFEHPEALDHKPIRFALEFDAQYTGHHGKSGLQGHSIGDEYPFVIYKVGHSDGPDKWAVLDGSTGHYHPERFDTYPQAQAFIKELNNA